jgi:radial spoke head protein 9
MFLRGGIYRDFERHNLKLRRLQTTSPNPSPLHSTEKMSSPLSFWGKLMGDEQDYLVAYALAPAFGFPTKKFYFCTTSNFTLKQMPELSEEYAGKAAAVTGRFKGDPSFPLEEPPEESPDDEEGTTESFREIHRLSYTVGLIDHDVSIVPVGSFIADAAKQIIKNKSFEGLSYGAAGALRSYVHFRKAESPIAIASVEKPGLSRPGDIFDSITDDKPAGAWSVNYSSSNTSSYLRSMYWPGYFFFQTVGKPEYGGVYFGNGIPNKDLAFGL